MFRLDERPLRRFLPSLRNVIGLAAFLLAVFLLAVGGWGTAAGATFLVLWLTASYRMTLVADADGLRVVNRFSSWRVSWADVKSISSVRDRGLYVIGRSIVIRKKGWPWSVEVTAVNGLSSERLDELARQIVAFGQSHGHAIAGGSESDTARHEVAAEGWSVDPPNETGA